MTRIDLDDLPPRVATQLAAVGPGEEVLLVQSGAVVARLVGAASAPPGDADPAPDAEARAQEIFELFRASVEDEF